MTAHRAILFGGPSPIDGRVMDDVPEETEHIKIPSNSNVKYAAYDRAGEGIDQQGRYLRFDFGGIYDSDDRLLREEP